MDIIAAAAFAGLFLCTLAWRMHQHDKAKYGATIIALFGAMALTFSGAWWATGLYRATSHGIGLLILAVVLAGCGADFVFQVIMKHPNFKKGRTTAIAAGLGVAGVLFIMNFSGIWHSVQPEITGHSVVQVEDHVNGTDG